MRKGIENFQKKLRLSSGLMDIYPEIQAKSHEEFLYSF